MVKVLHIGTSLDRSQLVSMEFFIHVKSFRSHYGPGVDSASNRNEYQEYFLGGKAGRCIRLTTLPPSCAVVMTSGNLISRTAQWLSCCATNRKLAGSIPVGVNGIFHWRNPSDRTLALWSAQPLTEMSARSISCGVKVAGA